ncbi:MAG: HpcH/HpaI aldolase/citrate lyase family protein, partial [Hyphomicrobiales bacterium]|nr:HpcH/HpaI aldolase/citrate lyase family protein [Hyphomicrobiales bacterium]
PGRAPLMTALSLAVTAARAHGIAILDGVFNEIADAEGFAAECRQGADLGFDGKTLIHPGQVETCNAVFSPAAEEVAQARAVIAAFDQPEHAGRGVVQLDGRMVERMHADIARRVVAIADAIEAAQSARA